MQMPSCLSPGFNKVRPVVQVEPRHAVICIKHALRKARSSSADLHKRVALLQV